MLTDGKIRFHCSHCGRAVTVNHQHAGKRGKCPGCAQVINIPAQTSALSGSEPATEKATQAIKKPQAAVAVADVPKRMPAAEIARLERLADDLERSASFQALPAVELARLMVVTLSGNFPGLGYVPSSIDKMKDSIRTASAARNLLLLMGESKALAIFDEMLKIATQAVKRLEE